MKDYFTIGELAKITGSTKKGLLYYEKIGLIKPASVNPENGYRYYSPAQIPVFENIQIGLLLGIPLKDMGVFFDHNKFFDAAAFFVYAKELAETKLHAIQHGLNLICYAQDEMKRLERLKDSNAPYERDFDKKLYLVWPHDPKGGEAAIYTALSRLFEKASAKDLVPLYERGLLYEYGADGVKTYVFMEIMPDENVRDIHRIIPAGKYKCCIIQGRQLDNRHELFPLLSNAKGTSFVIAVEIFPDNRGEYQPMSEMRFIVER